MTEISMGWFDLETTGLEANKDVPLELGLVLTDDWGNEYGSATWLIKEWIPSFQEGLRRGRENAFVNDMHTKSGLWNDLRTKDTCNRSQAAKWAIEFLKDHKVEPGTLPMCGNSIGSLDRPFTLVHFPELNEFLHYRNIDMSTLKEICKRVNPDLYENLKPIIGTKADATHRVLDDCRASIREYRAYLDEFLMVGD